MRDLFLVFEGPDGAGTGTQISLLSDRFFAQGLVVHQEEEPTCEDPKHRPWGLKADNVLKHIDPHPGAKALQELMVKDREDHVKQIQEWLGLGHIVICSRYMYCTLAYGEASGVSYAELWEMNKDFPRPNLAIYLDISAEEAMKRVQQRYASKGSPYEYFEKLEIQAKVRNFYLKLIDSPDFPEFQKVDGSLTPHQVHSEVVALITPRMEQHRW